MERGHFKQIADVPTEVADLGAALIRELSKTHQISAPYVDYDKKRRGSSLNYDVYGFDLDRSLIVYQARQAYCEYKDGYLSTRKTYALTGRNESGSPFWHPVSSGIVHAAIRKSPEDPAHVVDCAMAWIFMVKVDRLSTIVRQGDVALVPARPRGSALDTTEATLQDTHILRAAELRDAGGVLFARDPRMRHDRDQHAEVSAEGWYRVAIGRVGRAWDFSKRSFD